jgi:putative ABC transport system permease protein
VTARQLVLRGLRHYWRSHLAVIAGVATAVAVMAGALLVGDSVRGSLRDLALQRLGRTDRVITATTFFREALAGELNADGAFSSGHSATPLIVLRGVVSEPSRGRRVSHVPVYGIDDRFWQFHGVQGRTGPAAREAFLSRALAADLGVTAGGAILVRLEKPSDIPIESLHGRKDDPGRTVRLTVRDVVDAMQMGDFSVQPQQGSVRAVFVPMTRLQQDLEQPGRVNAMLIADRGASSAEDVAAALRRHAALADFGLTLRALEPQHAIAIESSAGVLDDVRAAAVDRVAASAGLRSQPVLTYLANSIRGGGREVPYSLVTASSVDGLTGDRPIVLNEWTARDLGVKVGDPIALDYYVWVEPGRLVTRHADFTLRAIVPLTGAAADRDFAPRYPGITDADTLGDWDPPFPIDLKRVRPADEAYWKQYRTTPKAFVPFAVGAELWGTRYGHRTSTRLIVAPGESLDAARARFEPALLAALDPSAAGLVAQPVRARALAASAGATDFGEYFVYFSFFLVVSALVLAALFFRLGVEQRAREVGLLRAVGFRPARVRLLFTIEGVVVAIAGGALGAAGAIAYAALMMKGLRTWWSGAVGTTALTLHVSAASIAAGAAGAIVAAVVCIWWSLRGLRRLSERELLAGRVAGESALVPRASLLVPVSGALLAAAAMGLVVAGAESLVAQAGAFFGAGSALLGAGLCGIAGLLRRPPHSVEGHGWTAIARVGWRNATQRPGRSVLAIAVIASAAFIVIAVDAFRRGTIDPSDPHSGTGGFPLLVDLDLPLVHDPNSRDGREALGVADLEGVSFVPFRVLPGEDVSCLNLYQPTSPRVLGASRAFVAAGRFAFQSSLAGSGVDRANPWRLLEQPQADGTIPVIADANSMTYVLHKSLGDVIPLAQSGRTIRLKLVAALADSVLQGELVMADANFTALFPEQQGYRFLLVDAPASRGGVLETAIEKGAADFGADAIPAAARLAEFHAVENTYLSTFQTLGGLGLLVGTIGLAAVLLRNVLERRRELALLRAVGYRPSHLFGVIFAENALLLVCGVALGAVAAAVAVGPAAMAHGARLPISEGGVLLLAGVLAAGLVSSMLATRVALASPLVGALRAD